MPNSLITIAHATPSVDKQATWFHRRPYAVWVEPGLFIEAVVISSSALGHSDSTAIKVPFVFRECVPWSDFATLYTLLLYLIHRVVSTDSRCDRSISDPLEMHNHAEGAGRSSLVLLSAFGVVSHLDSWEAYAIYFGVRSTGRVSPSPIASH